MTTATNNGSDTSEVQGRLCELLLELAGRNAGRMLSARRHVTVLDAAYPYMTTEQRAETRRRIRTLETKWGPMLPGEQNFPETDEMAPVSRVARWLSTRRTPERYLYVIRRAAIMIAGGETSLTAVMDHAFARETDYVLTPVGFDSFKEWMIELRIARRECVGRYLPGSLCGWWVSEMMPSKDKGTAYQACLEHAQRQ